MAAPPTSPMFDFGSLPSFKTVQSPQANPTFAGLKSRNVVSQEVFAGSGALLSPSAVDKTSAHVNVSKAASAWHLTAMRQAHTDTMRAARGHHENGAAEDPLQSHQRRTMDMRALRHTTDISLMASPPLFSRGVLAGDSAQGDTDDGDLDDLAVASMLRRPRTIAPPLRAQAAGPMEAAPSADSYVRLEDNSMPAGPSTLASGADGVAEKAKRSVSPSTLGRARQRSSSLDPRPRGPPAKAAPFRTSYDIVVVPPEPDSLMGSAELLEPERRESTARYNFHVPPARPRGVPSEAVLSALRARIASLADEDEADAEMLFPAVVFGQVIAVPEIGTQERRGVERGAPGMNDLRARAAALIPTTLAQVAADIVSGKAFGRRDEASQVDGSPSGKVLGRVMAVSPHVTRAVSAGDAGSAADYHADMDVGDAGWVGQPLPDRPLNVQDAVVELASAAGRGFEDASALLCTPLPRATAHPGTTPPRAHLRTQEVSKRTAGTETQGEGRADRSGPPPAKQVSINKHSRSSSVPDSRPAGNRQVDSSTGEGRSARPAVRAVPSRLLAPTKARMQAIVEREESKVGAIPQQGGWPRSRRASLEVPQRPVMVPASVPMPRRASLGAARAGMTQQQKQPQAAQSRPVPASLKPSGAPVGGAPIPLPRRRAPAQHTRRASLSSAAPSLSTQGLPLPLPHVLLKKMELARKALAADPRTVNESPPGLLGEKFAAGRIERRGAAVAGGPEITQSYLKSLMAAAIVPDSQSQTGSAPNGTGTGSLLPAGMTIPPNVLTALIPLLERLNSTEGDLSRMRTQSAYMQQLLRALAARMVQLSSADQTAAKSLANSPLARKVSPRYTDSALLAERGAADRSIAEVIQAGEGGQTGADIFAAGAPALILSSPTRGLRPFSLPGPHDPLDIALDSLETGLEHEANTLGLTDAPLGRRTDVKKALSTSRVAATADGDSDGWDPLSSALPSAASVMAESGLPPLNSAHGYGRMGTATGSPRDPVALLNGMAANIRANDMTGSADPLELSRMPVIAAKRAEANASAAFRTADGAAAARALVSSRLHLIEARMTQSLARMVPRPVNGPDAEGGSVRYGPAGLANEQEELMYNALMTSTGLPGTSAPRIISNMLEGTELGKDEELRRALAEELISYPPCPPPPALRAQLPEKDEHEEDDTLLITPAVAPSSVAITSDDISQGDIPHVVNAARAYAEAEAAVVTNAAFSSSTFVQCAECETSIASRRCHECSEDFCDDCFISLHKKGRRKEHLWTRRTSPPCRVAPAPPPTETSHAALALSPSTLQQFDLHSPQALEKMVLKAVSNKTSEMSAAVAAAVVEFNKPIVVDGQSIAVRKASSGVSSGDIVKLALPVPGPAMESLSLELFRRVYAASGSPADRRLMAAATRPVPACAERNGEGAGGGAVGSPTSPGGLSDQLARQAHDAVAVTVGRAAERVQHNPLRELVHAAGGGVPTEPTSTLAADVKKQDYSLRLDRAVEAASVSALTPLPPIPSKSESAVTVYMSSPSLPAAMAGQPSASPPKVLLDGADLASFMQAVSGPGGRGSTGRYKRSGVGGNLKAVSSHEGERARAEEVRLRAAESNDKFLARMKGAQSRRG